jgi:hypothetical protein
MWSVYTVIAYFVLALTIPIGIAALTIWKKTRASRPVACPRDGLTASVGLDPRYAMRMHALGNPELLVRQCTRWPEYGGCGQECRQQIGVRL